MPIDTFASAATGGNSKGCEKGVGEAVGVGLGLAVGVGVGVVGGVGVGVKVGVAVGEAVGVGVGVDEVYWIVSTGGVTLSRESKRLAVTLVDSSPSTSQPKLVAGLSSHVCTSVTICAELQI
jgi:hypothetical protein